MAGSVKISGTISTVPPGSVDVSATLTPSTADLVQNINVILASGANTIPVPSWATAVLIEPSPSNAVALILKGVTGDTGNPISKVAPTLISFPSTPPGQIVITAASLQVTSTTFTFF